VATAPIWQSFGEPKELVTTSVERIKGLEYDACFVIGMDGIENSALKHSKNRAYVALSRPSLQLTILCEEIPKSLQRIDKDLLEIVHI
jgi:DNA helicase IV